MKYLLPIILLGTVISTFYFLNIENTKIKSTKTEQDQTKEDNESDNINAYEKGWKTVERKNSKKEIILEYYKDDKLILNAVFSKKEDGEDFVWENLLREEWFDESGKLFIIASDKNVDTKFKYIDYWHSDESVSLDCLTNKIGNVTVEKVRKEDDVDIFINRKPTEYNCGGSGPCVTCDYFTEYNGFNINYSPPNEGCFSRHYFPSSHQGTIFISKHKGNENELDSYDFYVSLIESAIEKNFCQLKK